MLVGGAVGVLIGAGAMLAFGVSERQQQAAGDEVVPQVLPSGASAVLTALRSASAVVDRGEATVWASPAAQTLGLVRDGRVASDEVLRAVRSVRVSGDPKVLELQPRRRRGGPRVVLHVRITPLTEELVLIVAEDRSELARVDDVRRDFVANVSHELKTPVGALSLLAEAVEGASDDPEAVLRFAGRMQHEAARLASMVNELIELSRLQNDDPLSHASLVSVDDVVADAVDFVRMGALAKHIELVTTGDHGLHVLGVREQLASALRNLIDNALAYSAERTRVVVATRSVPDPDDGSLHTVEISVADQGIGIADDDQGRVFERFYRVDPARSRATGGTGLGLAIVRNVCANHGGEVTIWSVEGSGSTFTLRLPAHADQLASPDQFAPPGPGQLATPGQLASPGPLATPVEAGDPPSVSRKVIS